jgi:hypothetical protein
VHHHSQHYTVDGISAGEGRPPYDIAVASHPAPYAKAGATWWLAEFPPETVSLDQVRGVLRDGPADIDIERIR